MAKNLATDCYSVTLSQKAEAIIISEAGIGMLEVLKRNMASVCDSTSMREEEWLAFCEKMYFNSSDSLGTRS